MKDLSIIIVNYNVKDFLLQCLDSIFRSETKYSFEVIIVDNASVDNSVEMLLDFNNKHSISIIENKKNVGFSAGNNIGFKNSNARHILLLNPDTVVSKNTIEESLDFIYSNENVGALGVKMIDGKGHFLEESKRGFPSLSASIFKLTGIYKLFRSSSYFNAYYMGHLSRDLSSKVEVLCGAFMLMPSKIYREVGGLDERYFMYGEDIDLSYQIKKAGYDIWYFPESSIIHYKGESTKKASIKYYKTFYNAMLLFVQKNFSIDGNLLSFFFQIVISVFGLIAFLKSRMRSVIHVFLDMILSFTSLFVVQKLWAIYYKGDPLYFDGERSVVLYLGISITIAISYYLFGKYDKYAGLRKMLLSFVAAFVISLLVYSLLPVEMRNSRPVLLIALLLMFPLHTVTKSLYNLIKYGHFRPSPKVDEKLLIIGNNDEKSEIINLIGVRSNNFIGHYEAAHFDDKPLPVIIEEIKELDISQIIFSSNSIDFTNIIAIISKLGERYSYKITTQSNEALISSELGTSNDLHALDYKLKLSDPMHRRLKYIINFLLTIVCIPLLIPAVIFSKMGARIFREWISNLFFTKFWVGYDYRVVNKISLPPIASCTFPVSSVIGKNDVSQSELRRVNLYYAKDYSILTDIEIFFKNIL